MEAAPLAAFFAKQGTSHDDALAAHNKKDKEEPKKNNGWPVEKMEIDIGDDLIAESVKRFFFDNKHKPDLITDYDAVGFDLDNCLVKFNV